MFSGLFQAGAQTVPNGDFETWDTGLLYDNPTGWSSPNESLSSIPFNNTYVVEEENTDVHSGSAAVKLRCRYITSIAGNFTVPGYITLGTIEVNTQTQEVEIIGGVPFTDRPDQLEGYYDYTPVGVDQFSVEVVLLNYNASTQTIIDTIGAGYFVTSTATSGYTQFIAPITYFSTATPNYMNINILCTSPTNPVANSEAYVDDLSFYTAPTQPTDLFISEYIEGSSNNKAFEIFNGTGATVDLANYQIAQAVNGGGWAYYHTFPAGASIANNDVWVIITDQVDTSLFSAANADQVMAYPSVVHFNGDDARALIKIIGTDTIIVDQFGNPDIDPGSAWDVAGTTEATKNHTLVRKSSVLQGTTDWSASFGTDAANSEWVVYNQNDFSFLGFHSLTSPDPTLTIDQPQDGSMVYSSDVDVSFTVANFTVGTPSSPAQGFINYSLDGAQADSLFSTSAFTLNGLSLGQHSLVMWLVDAAGQALSPAVEDSISFTVALNSEANIVAFHFPGQVGASMIDTSNHTITVYMPGGTDLSNLIPMIDISTGATINPASGVAQDFTVAVTYTVTAQDGTIQTWTVNVMFAPDADLFFSEYIEGSGNNKAIEIYNPGGASMSLDNYFIGQSVNGSGWSYNHFFPAGASIASHDVWVIITDQVDTTLFSPGDADEVLSYPSVVHFNGNDARGLFKVVGSDTLLIDVIGVPTVDPGAGWDVAGVSEATKDHTIIRKPTVGFGNTDWALSAGTDAGNSEWMVMDVNTFSNLGFHNTGNNLPPVISNLTILPEVVTSADNVFIGATIIDDGAVTSVTFDWGTDGITFPNNIVLSAAFDIYSTFPDYIPAQPAGTMVYFRYIAWDDLGDSTVFVGSYEVQMLPVDATIYEIQGQTAASPYEGQLVNTGGIVTAVIPGSAAGYFVQDGTGAWNGVFVYDNQNTPAIGDDITFTALVSEYYDLTELKEVTNFTIVSSGNTLPAPVALSTNDVNMEDYEGVFVSLTHATCTELPNTYGEWLVDDGSGSAMIDNNPAYEYTPNLNDAYNILGVVTYNFGDYKIEIRQNGDVSPWVGIPELSNNDINLYPNPASDRLFVQTNTNIQNIEVYDVLGNLLYKQIVNSENIEINTSDLKAGIYFIRAIGNNNNLITRSFIKK